MAETKQAPDRIEPFFDTPESGKELHLHKEDNATLKQDGKEVKGTVQIT